jgi:hypothetical protein
LLAASITLRNRAAMARRARTVHNWAARNSRAGIGTRIITSGEPLIKVPAPDR